MDIFIGYLTGCVRYKPPVNSAPKGNSKFENLLVKVFSLKTKKQNQLLPGTIEKIKFLLSKKIVNVSLR